MIIDFPSGRPTPERGEEESKIVPLSKEAASLPKKIREVANLLEKEIDPSRAKKSISDKSSPISTHVNRVARFLRLSRSSSDESPS